jgi:hypothetical protein
LKLGQAKAILAELLKAHGKWRKVGHGLGLKAPTLDAYADAFENPTAAEAGAILS